VTSDYQGPVKGTLVMARHLDKTYMTTLSSLTSLKISLVPDISAGSIASIFAPDRLLTPGTQRVINFIDDNDMQAYFTLKDLGGNVVAVFEIDHDRSSNLLAIQLLENLLIVFALMAVLLVFTTIWLLDRFILGRLSKFSSQVMNYETNPGLIERIDIHRNDELTSLEKVAQRTFRELAVSRKKIKDHADKIGIERKKLDAILNGIAEGVFVVNREGKILMVNHEARRLSGWLSSELIAAPFYRKLKFLDKDQHLIDLNSLRQVFGKNPQIVTQGDAFFFPKNGSPIPVTLSAAPIRAHQDVFSSVVVFKDMSREHAIDKMKSEFVSITSHQLRTPLTGIKWMLSLLFQGNAGELNSKQLEYLRNVNTSNERMIQLVSDLLNISRIESMPAQQLENKDCDLAKLMHDVMAEQRASARVLGVVLRSDPAGVVGLRQPVTGDSEKLFQAFANLVNNAIKYSRRGGEVVVGSCIDGNFVRISFKDSGIGIPAAQQPMVFQKFFRADNALKSVAVGTGLGLYYVKSVIEAHGGKVWFSSVRNKGTTFYLTLPIKKQGAGINARARTP
jgi:PAS domain S-box-containing protein